MHRVKSRNKIQPVFDLDKGRTEAYKDCRLSYRNIATRVGGDPVTVISIWNRWIQEAYTKRHTGSLRPLITSSLEDRHVILKALIDRAAMSRAPSQELRSFAGQQLSARTVRRRLLQHGLSDWRPWLWLPLRLHHR
ncbi:HTH_Tnp_Tc3_2 domain-containing protein [Trichonephila clavipes]|nr:HTH_Tnp_Tc3_2 domain-containing protein [Trichonephila clavipes]